MIDEETGDSIAGGRLRVATACTAGGAEAALYDYTTDFIVGFE